MARKKIENYVFKPGIGLNDNLYPTAYSLLNDNKSFIQKEATAWIQTQVDAGAAGFVGYTYNSDKCERDVGFIIDAYLYDLRYGGNSKTSKYVGYYWDRDVAQVDGDRQPEIQTHGFIRDLITDYIFTNTGYAADNEEVSQTTGSANGESGASTRIDTLSAITISVITNGLSSMPALEETGVGYVKIQGKERLEDLLIITNTNKNEIIYNFGSSTTGGTIEYKEGEDDDSFPKYLQTTDRVTTLSLIYNTSTHSATDELQIFVDEKEVRTRPYDFGTDAIERMRVAPAISMLDADFEYGLQPTKWSAIATMRGYPSVYEIPGTDTPVVSVVTDASAGTSGVGASLITVTTVGAHGFAPGEPITIKALENSVAGASRAEGSFVITTVPDASTFTYYAKARVGRTAGEVLSTNYTQLRKGGFYTGASIGNPNWFVRSQGSNGSITAQLAVLAGSDIIPYDGPSPELGAPLVSNVDTLADPTPLAEGSQITAILDTSAGGGTYITPIVTANTSIGETEVEVASTVGIPNGLAVDRGDGYAIYVTGTTSNTIEFSGPFVNNVTANNIDYINISAANDTSSGIDATFDVSISGSNYVVVINNVGQGYEPGDKLLILGTDLGGSTPDNDLLLNVDSVQSGNEISGVSIVSGTPFDGTATVTGVSGTYAGGLGFGANFDVTWEDGVYTSVSIGSPDISQGFIVNDKLKILGNQIDSINGASPIHDLYIKVTGVGAGGAITSVAWEGTAPDVDENFANVPYTTSGIGNGAVIDILSQAGTYSVTFQNDGQDFLPTDTITILGTDVGGSSPANDITITVDSVGGIGDIVTFTASGTAFNGGASTPPPAQNVTGSGATFNVDLNAGVYTVTIDSAGIDYADGQELTIAGTNLLGSSPANDLTVTISTVDSLTAGAITAVTGAGTAVTSGGPYTNISATLQAFTGAAATFDVARNFGVYDLVDLNSAGSNYLLGDRLVINGVSLDGASPLNDINITVTGVDGLTGAITLFETDYIQANPGTNFDLISTVTISEPTIRNIALFRQFDYSSLATLRVVFDKPHGLIPGQTFIVSVSSDDGLNNHTLASGAFIASAIPTNTTLEYQARAAGTIDVSSDDVLGDIYTRPDSFFIHRPFDGGVQLGTGGPQHGAQAIRQSKNYIRYQSGKGIMYTTGALFAPSYDLRRVLASGLEVNDEITIVCDDNDHGCQVGGVIRLLGIETPGYNSGPETRTPPQFDYTVTDVIDERTLKVRAQRRLGDNGFGDYTVDYDDITVDANSAIVNIVDTLTGRLIARTTSDTSAVYNKLLQNDLVSGGIVRIVNGTGTYVVSYTSITLDSNDINFEGIQNIEGDITNFDDAPSDEGGTITSIEWGFNGYPATLGFGAQMSVVSWHGATVRSGIFDDQNGIFWEYDGTQISVVQRTGTFQITGTISIEVDSNEVVGLNTRFVDQLKAGDRIIIRGMTHVVSRVNSQTSMNVTPDFRGVVNISGAKAMLITDKKVKQSEFNLDRLDGTGPSGYDMDPAKMQMIGIQYSWYGAGFIDFMVRGADGNFVFAHRMRNSNVNTEAFMRSGNLPVRYEVTNEGPPGKLAAAMTNVQNYLDLEDSSFFPNSGTVMVQDEVMTFTGNDKTLNRLTGLTRGAALTNFQAGAQRNYTGGDILPHEDRTGVILVSNTITPLISHWGSAFITDGGFDEDRGYIFSYSEAGIEATTTKQTAFMIRLAPSVSNAITGDLGERELLNRAQLLLQGIEITSDTGTGGIVIEGVLNPQNYPSSPDQVTWSDLNSKAQGGQPSFAQVASGGGIEWTTAAIATTVDVNWQSNMSLTGVTNAFFVDANGGTRDSFLYVPRSAVTDQGLRVGAVCTTTPFNNRRVTSVNNNYTFNGQPISRIDFDGPASNEGTNYNIGTLSLTFTFNTERTRSPIAFFTQASWNSSGLTQGSAVDPTDTNWPANTSVADIQLLNFGATNYYEVRFNNSSTTSLSGVAPDVVTFTAGDAAFAEPGETVFSFIAVPGERSMLDLSQLKELTNTTLGGRGTFPNGPDVLAINVYKVSGAASNANIILRWGEAQA